MRQKLLGRSATREFIPDGYVKKGRPRARETHQRKKRFKDWVEKSGGEWLVVLKGVFPKRKDSP